MVDSLVDSLEFQDFLKALTSETRQRILFLFRDGKDRTVNEVAQALKLGQSTASEHLSLLKRGGLMQARREGKEVYYRPDRKRMLDLLSRLSDALSCCCPPTDAD